MGGTTNITMVVIGSVFPDCLYWKRIRLWEDLSNTINLTSVMVWAVPSNSSRTQILFTIPESRYQNRPCSFNKASLSTSKKIRVIKKMFSHHNGIKLEASNKDSWKIPNYLGTLLLNYGEKEKTKGNSNAFWVEWKPNMKMRRRH